MINSIIAMVVCVVLSAYFSATETAFSSLNKTRLKAMAESGNRKAILTLELSENYDRLISTILIGNNIVNIAVASIGTLLFVNLLGQEVGAPLSTAVVTVVVLIFGEITPKSIAKDYPEKFAMFSSPFLRVLIWILMPLNFIFESWKKLVGKLFHVSEDSKMSQEELLLLLDEVEQEGAIDQDEGRLLRNAVEFGELETQDILTHRVDLEAVDLRTSKEDIAKRFEETHYSRLLVYDETIDKIVGILHQKDFYVGTGITTRPLTEIMSAPVFVHETEKIDSLLQKMRSIRTHIAIVVDEYGGVSGIVTMEDILEELVGEIWDEHDEVDEPIRKSSEDTYTVDCRISLNDFCEFFEIKVDSECISLGGWIMQYMGCIPTEGDHFEFEHLMITIAKTEDHRIASVAVKVQKADPILT